MSLCALFWSLCGGNTCLLFLCKAYSGQECLYAHSFTFYVHGTNTHTHAYTHTHTHTHSNTHTHTYTHTHTLKHAHNIHTHRSISGQGTRGHEWSECAAHTIGPSRNAKRQHTGLEHGVLPPGQSVVSPDNQCVITA